MDRYGIDILRRKDGITTDDGKAVLRCDLVLQLKSTQLAHPVNDAIGCHVAGAEDNLIEMIQRYQIGDLVQVTDYGLRTVGFFFQGNDGGKIAFYLHHAH